MPWGLEIVPRGRSAMHQVELSHQIGVLGLVYQSIGSLGGCAERLGAMLPLNPTAEAA